MNYSVIRYTLGWVLNIEAACLALPLLCSLIYGERCAAVFLLCALICLAVGVSLVVRKPKNKLMYAKEGYITVALSWITMSLFGALPFTISGCIPSYVDALFETVSGFTTTGASILTDIDSLPRGIIFWRSFTHWIGGMGVLVFLMAIIPLCGGMNMHLLRAESTGPSVSKLVPKVKSSAKILYLIYASLTLVQIILLLIGKMPLFDALTISFGTAGTGGFAIKNSSISGYSMYLQNVISIFMIIFGVDFAVYYLILLRKFSSCFRSEEVRAYLIIIAVASIIIGINCRGYYDTLSQNITHSLFQVASIITTTGYMTVDFDKWPELSKTILIVLMFIGACAGSTGGGMKVSRILILVKSVFKEVKIAAHPNSVYKVKFSGRLVEHETMRSVNVYAMSFAAVYAISLLIISLDNFNFTTNFTAIATTINNVGPGFDLVGPTKNFSIYSPLSKLVMTFDMLFGRLEVFPMLVLFSRHTWRS